MRRYRDLLSVPGALRAAGPAALARLGYTMTALALLLVVSDGHSYALAGAVSAAWAVGASVAGPVLGRVIDRARTGAADHRARAGGGGAAGRDRPGPLGCSGRVAGRAGLRRRHGHATGGRVDARPVACPHLRSRAASDRIRLRGDAVGVTLCRRARHARRRRRPRRAATPGSS